MSDLAEFEKRQEERKAAWRDAPFINQLVIWHDAESDVLSLLALLREAVEGYEGILGDIGYLASHPIARAALARIHSILTEEETK